MAFFAVLGVRKVTVPSARSCSICISVGDRIWSTKSGPIHNGYTERFAIPVAPASDFTAVIEVYTNDSGSLQNVGKGSVEVRGISVGNGRSVKCFLLRDESQQGSVVCFVAGSRHDEISDEEWESLLRQNPAAEIESYESQGSTSLDTSFASNSFPSPVQHRKYVLDYPRGYDQQDQSPTAVEVSTFTPSESTPFSYTAPYASPPAYSVPSLAASRPAIHDSPFTSNPLDATGGQYTFSSYGEQGVPYAFHAASPAMEAFGFEPHTGEADTLDVVFAHHQPPIGVGPFPFPHSAGERSYQTSQVAATHIGGAQQPAAWETAPNPTANPKPARRFFPEAKAPSNPAAIPPPPKPSSVSQSLHRLTPVSEALHHLVPGTNLSAQHRLVDDECDSSATVDFVHDNPYHEIASAHGSEHDIQSAGRRAGSSLSTGSFFPGEQPEVLLRREASESPASTSTHKKYVYIPVDSVKEETRRPPAVAAAPAHGQTKSTPSTPGEEKKRAKTPTKRAPSRGKSPVAHKHSRSPARLHAERLVQRVRHEVTHDEESPGYGKPRGRSGSAFSRTKSDTFIDEEPHTSHNSSSEFDEFGPRNTPVVVFDGEEMDDSEDGAGRAPLPQEVEIHVKEVRSLKGRSDSVFIKTSLQGVQHISRPAIFCPNNVYSLYQTFRFFPNQVNVHRFDEKRDEMVLYLTVTRGQEEIGVGRVKLEGEDSLSLSVEVMSKSGEAACVVLLDVKSKHSVDGIQHVRDTPRTPRRAHAPRPKAPQELGWKLSCTVHDAVGDRLADERLYVHMEAGGKGAQTAARRDRIFEETHHFPLPESPLEFDGALVLRLRVRTADGSFPIGQAEVPIHNIWSGQLNVFDRLNATETVSHRERKRVNEELRKSLADEMDEVFAYESMFDPLSTKENPMPSRKVSQAKLGTFAPPDHVMAGGRNPKLATLGKTFAPVIRAVQIADSQGALVGSVRLTLSCSLLPIQQKYTLLLMGARKISKGEFFVTVDCKDSGRVQKSRIVSCIEGIAHWNEAFHFQSANSCVVKIHMSTVTKGKTTTVGKVEFDIVRNKIETPKWVDLDNGAAQLLIQTSTAQDSAARVPKSLISSITSFEVTVKNAAGLPLVQGGQHQAKGFTVVPDTYVSVGLDETRYTTSVKFRNCNPTWNESFRFMLHSNSSFRLQISVHTQKANWHTAGSNEIGTAVLDLLSLPLNHKYVDVWTVLHHTVEQVGRIRLRVVTHTVMR